MNNFLKEQGEKITFYIFLVYTAGFVVWNSYLAKFGMFESNLLQTRFISAGILSLALPALIIHFDKKSKACLSKRGLIVCAAYFVIWSFAFSTLFFNLIPQWLGGARPYLASVIVDKEMQHSIELMGLQYPIQGGESVETIRGCKIYENDQQILLGMVHIDDLSTSSTPWFTFSASSGRVLAINKSKVDAQSILPQDQGMESVKNISVYQTVCGAILRIYSAEDVLNLFVNNAIQPLLLLANDHLKNKN